MRETFLVTQHHTPVYIKFSVYPAFISIQYAVFIVYLIQFSSSKRIIAGIHCLQYSAIPSGHFFPFLYIEGERYREEVTLQHNSAAHYVHMEFPYGDPGLEPWFSCILMCTTLS